MTVRPAADLSEKAHFAFAAQGKYSLQLSTAVAGLLHHLPDDLHAVLWVLDLEAESSTRQRVERVVASRNSHTELRWIQVSETDLGHVEAVGHLTSATYARLLLPSILPVDAPAVLYLDADLVVLRDLSTLVSACSSNQPIAAVRDFSVHTVGGPRSGIADVTTKPAATAYFNAGVLAMNLDVWRRRTLAAEVLRFAHTHGGMKHGDQDALNAVLDDWRELPWHWNVQSSINWLDGDNLNPFERELERQRSDLLREAAVIHFTGPSKPWQPGYRGSDAKIWRNALRLSGALSQWELMLWTARYVPQRILARAAISSIRVARRASQREHR